MSANEPACIWSLRLVAFDTRIPLSQNVILSQAYLSLRVIVEKIISLRLLLDTSPIKGIYISPEIPGLLSDICFQVGVASTILFKQEERQGHRETDVAYASRIERTKLVAQWCAECSIDVRTLRDQAVRHALTHIDEHLANAQATEPNLGWLIDAAIDSRDQFTVPDGISLRFCRCYVRTEDAIAHLGNSISLSDLENECRGVLRGVFGVDWEPMDRSMEMDRLDEKVECAALYSQTGGGEKSALVPRTSR